MAGAFNLSGAEALYGRYWGCFEERALPPLQRLPLPGHGRDGRPGADPLRARGRRRAQAGPGLHSQPSPTARTALFHRCARPGGPGVPRPRATAIAQGMPAWRAETGFKELERCRDARARDRTAGRHRERRRERKLKRPQLYKVLFHNDNYTTRDFVVAVLREVFHKSGVRRGGDHAACAQPGIGVAGVYTYDVARTKIEMVETLAREHEFPLAPDDGTGGDLERRGNAAHRQGIAGQLPPGASPTRRRCATST